MYNDTLSVDQGNLYDLRRVRRTSSLNVLHEKDYEDKSHYAESICEKSSSSPRNSHDSKSDGSVIQGGHQDLDPTIESRKGIDLSGIESSESLEEDDVRISDDITTDDDDDDNIEGTAIENCDTDASVFLNKAIDEDILRTLPSLCVFQVCLNYRSCFYLCANDEFSRMGHCLDL